MFERSQVIAKVLREVLIQLDFHAAATLRANTAAYATAARTSCSVSGGKCFVISFGESPSANESRTTATLIRVPRMHGSPPHTSDFTTTRFKSFLYAVSVISKDILTYSKGPVIGEGQTTQAT
jgi:hypothetical protein